MTSGNQVRDFVNVTDAAKQIVDRITRDDVTPGKPFIENVGSGKPTMVRDFAEKWWKRWDAKGKLIFGAVPHRPDEVMRYVPSLSDPNTGDQP